MTDRPRYTPPADDEPLDEIQQALVRMWIDILTNEIRAERHDEKREACSDANEREDRRTGT